MKLPPGMKKRPQLTGRAAILAVVVCAIAMSLAYPFREYVAQRRQISQLEQQQAQALDDLRKQQERHKELQDPTYTKEQARARLHYCGVGEKCYVVPDDPKAVKKARTTRTGEKAPWYQTVWESVEATDQGTGKRAAAQ
jgi:cell division protein FtsB